MVDLERVSGVSRQLAALLEPVAGQVYFSRECHKEYEAIGFAPSRGKAGDVELPDGPAYFTSRGSVMGQVPGELVAAAFGVFNPAAVIPSVQFGWSVTDAKTICDARTRGATAQLERILTPKPDGVDRVTELLKRACDVLRPEGRPLYSGLRSLGLPGDPVGDMWRLADLLREFRGDAHTAAWISAGIDATEINLLSELWMGLPSRSYARTRAWSDAEFDAAEERLRARGWFDDSGLTPEGHDARSEVERATDVQMATVVDALGADVDELFTLLEPWGVAIRAQGGYLAAGPHDLAKAALGR